MENLKTYLANKGLYPKVDFDDKIPHEFEVLKGKTIEYDDGSQSYKLLVKENGSLKTISTPSVLLEIQDCKPGDVYEVQLKYKTIGGKPFRNYLVKKIKDGTGKEDGAEETIKEEPQEELEIPVIEEGEDIGEPPF